jgi:hypothetical protein
MPYGWNMQVGTSTVASLARVEFVLRHPDDWRRTTRYGWCGERGGYWVEVMYDGARVVYDPFSDGYDHDRPLLGALRFMVEYSLLAPEDVADGISWLDDAPSRRERRPPRRLSKVVEVIRNFELAHG